METSLSLCFKTVTDIAHSTYHQLLSHQLRKALKQGLMECAKKRSETVKIFKSLEISLTPPELELSKTTSAFQVFRCEEAAWYVINSGNLERLLLGDDTNSMQFDGNMKRFRMTPFLNEEKQVQWKRE